jgi:pentatricopeptide repeat protein
MRKTEKDCETDSGDTAHCPIIGCDMVSVARYCLGTDDPPGLGSVIHDMRVLPAARSLASAWQCILVSCSSRGAWEVAASVLNAGHLFAGMDSSAYNVVIEGLASRGNVTRCVELCRAMRIRNFTPSDVTFSIVLKACIQAADFARLRGLLSDVISYGAPLTESQCASYIQGLVSAGHLEEAEELLGHLMQHSYANADAVAFHILLEAYAERGDAVDVFRVLELMVQQGIQPDALTFNSILAGFESTLLLGGSEILAIFDMLVGHGLRPRTALLSGLLKALASAEAWGPALGFLRGLPRRFGVNPAAILNTQPGGGFENVELKKMLEAAAVDAVSFPDEADGAAGDEMFAASRTTSYADDMPSTGMLTPRSGTPSTCAGLSGTPSPSLVVGDDDDEIGMPPGLTADMAATWRQNESTSIAACTPRLKQFVTYNNLDNRCKSMLSKLSQEQADWIMDQEFFIDKDVTKGAASTKVMRLGKKLKMLPAEFWDNCPTSSNLMKRLAAFIEINDLDYRCAKSLQRIPRDCLQKLMDQEFVLQVNSSRGTASAKVVGRIISFRSK